MSVALEKVGSNDLFVSFRRLMTPSRWIILGGTLGAGLVAVFAVVLRRKRRRKPFPKNSDGRRNYVDPSVCTNSTVRRRYTGTSTPSSAYTRTPVPPSLNSSRSHTPAPTSFGQDLEDSTLTGSIVQQHSPQIIGPEKLCSLGLDSLAQAIKHWEDALELLEMDDADSIVKSLSEMDIMPLQDQLHSLLSRTYRIREQYETNIYNKIHFSAAVSSVVQSLEKAEEAAMRSESECSDTESFVSAVDIADLSDLEEEKASSSVLSQDLYRIALNELDNGNIPCRTLRTKTFGCKSDTEFLAKMYCVRLAFNEIFKSKEIKDYFTKYGKLVIGEMMIKSERDPEDFYNEFDSMVEWVSDESNWKSMREELKARAVADFNFFDIVLDFIVFDAFDDLENPPSAITTIMNNRWLTNSFKESALATACWSVSKAKRSRLQSSTGFLAHFYTVTECCSPMFAWAFLGPQSPVKDLCTFFKDQVISFMQRVFSFQHVRFTTVNELATDILKQGQIVTTNLLENLNIPTDEAVVELKLNNC
ncbi:unnamed protein product [Dimorphilus gyrociliatus]|uniref:Uncharacterized protein n=1 Tax=Dimorphilus gyrociliatus TaxID=2664684 RepID=A0A7I8VNU5_9ANNE|nr:unnamed protein product [Dimorphilus gyrociliatus]